MPVDSRLYVAVMLRIGKQLRVDCLCLSLLYGFHCHNHLKQGPLDSCQKNKTQKMNLVRTVVRNGSASKLKIQLLDELKPRLHQVMNRGVYVERLLNRVLLISWSFVKGNKELSHMVRTLFSSFISLHEFPFLAFQISLL